jgi:hypothetical protein
MLFLERISSEYLTQAHLFTRQSRITPRLQTPIFNRSTVHCNVIVVSALIKRLSTSQAWPRRPSFVRFPSSLPRCS